MAKDSCYYDVLEVDPSASLDHIKASYQKLILIYHPDKQAQVQAQASRSRINKEFEEKEKERERDTAAEKIDTAEKFCMVHEAWKTLSDKEQRAAYDLERCRRKMQSNDRSLADNVNFSDFEVVEEDEDGDMLYAKPCRCGEYYMVNSSIILTLTDSIIIFNVQFAYNSLLNDAS